MSKNKNVIIAVVVVVLVVLGALFFMGGAGSSCTAEQYAKKAQTLQADIIALQQKDPKGFQAAMVKMQEAAQKLAKNPNDFSAACKALDEISAIAKK